MAVTQQKQAPQPADDEWDYQPAQNAQAAPTQASPAPSPSPAAADSEWEYQPPAKPQGAFTRFLDRYTGLPIQDIKDHPNAYLNPFSHDFSQRQKDEQHATEMAAEGYGWQPGQGDPQTFLQVHQGIHVPGSDTIHDIRDKNYAGAVGDVLPTALAASQVLGPKLAGITQRPGFPKTISRMGKLGGGGAGAYLMRGGGLMGEALGAAGGSALGGAAAEMATPAMQKLGGIMARTGVNSIPRYNAVEPLPRMLTAGTTPLAQSELPDTAPIARTPGKIIVRDPKTGQMKTFFTNSPAEEVGGTQFQKPEPKPQQPQNVSTNSQNTPPATAKPNNLPVRDPKTGRMMKAGTPVPQPEATQVNSPAAPKPAAAPLPIPGKPTASAVTDTAPAKVQNNGQLTMPPDARISRPASGESAARTTLPDKMDDLIKIANKRGIKVTTEDLKPVNMPNAKGEMEPRRANSRLLERIIDSMTDDELAEFEAQSQERSRFPRTQK